MSPQDMFVAGVAFAIGLFALSGAVLNWDWYYQLEKAQRIESRWGRGAARGFYTAVGMALIGLALVICTTCRSGAPSRLSHSPAEASR